MSGGRRLARARNKCTGHRALPVVLLRRCTLRMPLQRVGGAIQTVIINRVLKQGGDAWFSFKFIQMASAGRVGRASGRCVLCPVGRWCLFSPD